MLYCVLAIFASSRHPAAYISSVSSCAVNQRDVSIVNTCLYKHHDSAPARLYTHVP